MKLMPTIISSRDIQRNYRKIFNKAKATKKPIVVLTNNKPDVAIIDIGHLESLYAKAQESELNQALSAIKAYRQAKTKGKLVKTKSLADFVK